MMPARDAVAGIVSHAANALAAAPSVGRASKGILRAARKELAAAGVGFLRRWKATWRMRKAFRRATNAGEGEGLSDRAGEALVQGLIEIGIAAIVD